MKYMETKWNLNGIFMRCIIWTNRNPRGCIQIITHKYFQLTKNNQIGMVNLINCIGDSNVLSIIF